MLLELKLQASGSKGNILGRGCDGKYKTLHIAANPYVILLKSPKSSVRDRGSLLESTSGCYKACEHFVGRQILCRKLVPANIPNMHEIVTLQIGQQANYVATHFWNVQESYFNYSEDPETESPVNHDVHFRPGVAPDGTDTFTPRTVIYDFKNAFGTLRRINELYDVLDDRRADALSWYVSLLVAPARFDFST